MNLAALVCPHPAEGRALWGEGRWHTWGDVRRRAAAVAAGLPGLGVGAGDRVALAWPTSVDFVVAYLGVLAAGAVAVPLNPNSPAEELRRELEVVEPAALLAAHGGVSAGAGVPAARLVTPGPGAGGGASWEGLSGLSTAGGVALEPVERADDDLAVLLFTSGTAGAPRAAMLTHGNLLANVHQMLALPDILRADDVGLVAIPLFHVFGLNVALGLCAATGAALVLDSRFDAEASLRQVRELAVTTLLGVPAMFAAWADASEPGANGASPLAGVRRAISGASALDPAVAARFEERHGIALWQGYGLTEASPAVSTSFGTGRNRPGSVGPPLPGVEVRLVDEEGDPVLEGDPGEIWVRGANVFAGYWRDPEATARVLTSDGWLRTGDIGVVGEDGDLFVVDRSKDLVIVSGFNVFPGEVERVVCSLPGVAECVVVGRPDEATGERVEAVVVPAEGAEVSAEEVRSHCAARLARYKCPTSVRFVPSLPHGLTGKALRRALREETPA
ncbi:MAG TPA: AMP-binding protein [Acidimicrobiales bacterium]|nr:AMP-binding protein [Acidimicrobiales bacterium]